MALLKDALQSRLASYGSMSIALAASAFAPKAQASIILTTLNPELTTPDNGYIFFNLSSGSAGTSATEPLASHPGSFFFSNLKSGLAQKAKLFGFSSTGIPNPVSNAFAVSPGRSFASSVARLGPGDLVGSQLGFALGLPSLASNAVHPFGHFNSLGEGFVGLRFLDNGTFFYGWADIVLNGDYTVSLKSFAFDDEGNLIAAGDTGPEVPEPASILLMALGATGVAAYKRMRDHQS
jgi:PEP-CTERM motif